MQLRDSLDMNSSENGLDGESNIYKKFQYVDKKDEFSDLSKSVTIKLYMREFRNGMTAFTVDTPALYHQEITTSLVLLDSLVEVINVIDPYFINAIYIEEAVNIISSGEISKLFSNSGGITYFSKRILHDIENFLKIKSEGIIYRLYETHGGYLTASPFGVGNEACYYIRNSEGELYVDGNIEAILTPIHCIHLEWISNILSKVRLNFEHEIRQ